MSSSTAPITDAFEALLGVVGLVLTLVVTVLLAALLAMLAIALAVMLAALTAMFAIGLAAKLAAFLGDVVDVGRRVLLGDLADVHRRRAFEDRTHGLVRQEDHLDLFLHGPVSR